MGQCPGAIPGVGLVRFSPLPLEGGVSQLGLIDLGCPWMLQGLGGGPQVHPICSSGSWYKRLLSSLFSICWFCQARDGVWKQPGYCSAVLGTG